MSNKQSGQVPRRNSGQAVIMAVMFLLLVSMVIVVRGSDPARVDARLARNHFDSGQVAILAEAGSEDVTYRIRRAYPYDANEVLSLGGFSATTTVSDDISTGIKTVSTESSVRGAIRKKKVTLLKGEQVDFNYGVQAGTGGFIMANSAKVIGNVYSNGVVTGAGNTIQGSVVSADVIGKLDNIHATSSVWAHTVQDSTIDKDAYYQVRTNTTVFGSSYPGSVDKPTTTFPISEAQLDAWEAIAEDGGTISSPCPYEIKVDTTIGPKKINCDLEISNSAKITFSGMVWVVGTVTIKNSSGIWLDSSLGAKSVALIADNPANRSSSSRIELQNSTTFHDTGTAGSFLFLVSRNRSIASGGTASAIDLQNTAQGPVFLYTNFGKIAIGNSTKLKAVTGYTISMKNTAELTYDDGLESTLFDTGPGGSWNVKSWKEVE